MCVQWFRLAYPKLSKLLFAVPNGGSRNKIEAYNMKKEGVTAGVPDLLFLYNSNLYAIEMKAVKGRLTESQKDLHPIWNEHLVKEVFVCRSFERFQEIIMDIVCPIS